MSTPSKEDVHELYIVQGLQVHEVARRLGSSKKSIQGFLYRNGIRKCDHAHVFRIGDEFGKLVVIGLHEGNQARPICRCVCGNEDWYHRCNLLMEGRMSCGCLRGKHAAMGRGFTFDTISRGYWSSIKASARDRGLEFSLTIEEAWDVFRGQGGRCALSGVGIEFRKSSKGEQTASIDRIDSRVGYLSGNIQWLHKAVNQLKMNKDDPELVAWCIKIADHQRSKAVREKAA